MVTFKRKKIEKSSQKSSQKLSDLMKLNSSITIEELSKEINISDRAIKKHIYKLKQEGKIIRIGGDKGGYWKVIDNE